MIAGCGAPIDYVVVCTCRRDIGLLAVYGGGELMVQSIEALGYCASVSGDICHIDVIDVAGNIVSAILLGGWLQFSPVISVLGFLFGIWVQMMWFDFDAFFGMVLGCRLCFILTLTLVLDGGGWGYFACGTLGGD